MKLLEKKIQMPPTQTDHIEGVHTFCSGLVRCLLRVSDASMRVIPCELYVLHSHAQCSSTSTSTSTSSSK